MIYTRTEKQRNKETLGKRGTTIMELLVTMAIFLTFIDIATGVFIRSLRTQRIAVAQMAANSNASLAMEQMIREFRTGKDFCKDTGDCSPDPEQRLTDETPFTKLTFLKDNDKITYEIEQRTVQPSNQTIRSIKRTVTNAITSNSSHAYLTADNVDVRKLAFLITGLGSGDKYDPKVTIILQIGAPGIYQGAAIANLQTSVSVRIPTLDP